ncbi:MAG: cell division protein FtsZ [Candidatus Bathyarchaeota archaeon]|nr:cell division protein FtsZ [Candidatus Bathyarchaeota archaeon]
MTVELEVVPQGVPDKSIEDIARDATPKIAILGVGGGGSNIVTWMEKKIVGARTVVLNSDAQHLTTSKADERILLGYGLTGGLGCGGFPEQGAKAAEESALEIEQAIGDANLVFVTAALGGGTGTGAAPVVARIARELGALTIGVVTIPFKVEGTRLSKAQDGLKALNDICDSVVVIDNNKLRMVAGKLPVREAFAVANGRVTDFVNNITETLSVPGIMNLDFADMKAIMMGGGVCAVGFGEGHGGTKVEDAVNKALDNQLLDVDDIGKAGGALVHIEGGEDMTLEDINRAGEMVLESVSRDARVIWGSKINPNLEGKIRATVVLAGVDSPFLIQHDKNTVTVKQAKPKVIKIKSKKAAK